MSFRNAVLMIGAFVTFVLATLVSWYEGAQLRDIPWEWEHTAVFSNWANDGFTNANNLLAIDHFVYEAKFEPLFPLLMAISLLYMIFQLVFWLFKDHKAVRNLLLLSMAVTSFVLCSLLFDSPTTGFRLFSFFFGVVGVIAGFGVFRLQFRKEKIIKTA